MTLTALYIIIGIILILIICRQFIIPLISKPRLLGLKDGKLQNCPKTPNCVNSFADINDKRHYIEPITMSTSSEIAKNKIIKILKEMKFTKLVKDDENYLHFTVRSLLFGFIDDLEILINEKENSIHFRSCTRLGPNDQGVNRKRIEKIRKIYKIS